MKWWGSGLLMNDSRICPLSELPPGEMNLVALVIRHNPSDAAGGSAKAKRRRENGELWRW